MERDELRRSCFRGVSHQCRGQPSRDGIEVNSDMQAVFREFRYLQFVSLIFQATLPPLQNILAAESLSCQWRYGE